MPQTHEGSADPPLTPQSPGTPTVPGFRAPGRLVGGIYRFAMLLAGTLCLIAGAITLPLPLPTGLVLLAVGTALVLLASRRARIWFRRFRRRTAWLDRNLARVEHRLPADVRRVLSPRHSGPGPSSARPSPRQAPRD